MMPKWLQSCAIRDCLKSVQRTVLSIFALSARQLETDNVCQLLEFQRENKYHKTSNISCTQSQNFNISHFFLQLSAQSIAARCWVENEDVVGAAPTGIAPTTYEWSTIGLPVKVQLILEVCQYTGTVYPIKYAHGFVVCCFVVVMIWVHGARIIVWMHPANERWCYIVTSSVIGWVRSQNDP